MIINRKNTTPLTPAASPPAKPTSDLRNGLGWLATRRVNRIESQAKETAVGELAQMAVASAFDVQKTQIETTTTVLKTATTARIVPLMGALMEEATVRASQVRLGFQAAEKQGMKYQIEFRHQAKAEMAELHARGCLTDEELAEVQDYISKMTATGIARQSHDMDRVHDALGHHMDRLADHVKNAEKKGL